MQALPQQMGATMCVAVLSFSLSPQPFEKLVHEGLQKSHDKFQKWGMVTVNHMNDYVAEPRYGTHFYTFLGMTHSHTTTSNQQLPQSKLEKQVEGLLAMMGLMATNALCKPN